MPSTEELFGDFESRHNNPEYHRFGESLLLPTLPSDVGTVASEGDSTAPSRSNHVHVLATNSVTTATIADNAITSPKIADGAIDTIAYFSGMRPVTVNASAPSSPVEGDLWYETDTDSLWIYTTSTTGWKPPWNLPWGHVGSQGYTTATDCGINSTFGDTGLSITFTAVANRKYRVSFHAAKVHKITSNDTLITGITDGSNTVLDYMNVESVYANTDFSVSAELILTGIASGSYTVKVRAAGTDANVITWQYGSYTSRFSVEDIGPNAAPA